MIFGVFGPLKFAKLFSHRFPKGPVLGSWVEIFLKKNFVFGSVTGVIFLGGVFFFLRAQPGRAGPGRDFSDFFRFFRFFFVMDRC